VIGARLDLERPAATDEALLRYPYSGEHDGQRCTCTRECPAVCDGDCGCEACLRAWLDNDLDCLPLSEGSP
jgi:hypothetical protein